MDKMSLIALAKASKAGGGGGSFTQEQADWTQTDNTQVDYIKHKPDFATVATSGSYNDLSDKPDIPTVPTVDTALSTSSQNPIANAPVAEAIEDINTDLQSSQSVSSESGLVTINANGSNLTSCTTTLAPIQDLHGYDYPWVGGAGYNIWDEQWELGTLGWNTGQPQDATDTIRSKNYIEILPNTQYCITSLTIGATVYIYDENYDVISRILNYGLPTTYQVFTTPSNAKYLRFRSNAVATTYNNDICINLSNPLYNGNYYPYSNICPISGYDSAEYTRCGVNIFDKDTAIDNYRLDSVGELYAQSDSATSDYIRVKASTTYVRNKNMNIYENACLYDKQKQFISRIITGATIETTPTTAYVRIAMLKTDKDTTQLEQGTTATTYQPYQGQAVTLTFDNTIYSGTVDWCTGLVTVNKGMVDLGDLSWTQTENYASMFFTNVSSLNIPYQSTMLCSQYQVAQNRNDRGKDQSIYFIDSYYGSNEMAIKDSTKGEMSNEQFTQAMDGVQLLYELSTPITYQLTPTQLTTLKGTNTISTPQGAISLTYQPDNVIGELKKSIDDVEKEIPTTVFDGKKVMFIGDSFMEGFGARVADGLDSTTNPITTPAVADSTPMRGWAKAFKERYPKAEVHNLAIYGATIAYQNNNPSVMGQLTYIANNSLGGDYVVIDGGANDVFQGITKGSAKADDVYEEMNWDTMNYNTYQTLPCLEAIFAIFAEHFPTVRILFVSPPPMSVTMTEEMQTAVASMKTDITALCEKWGVKHIDIIGKGSKNTIYSNNTDYYTASDKIHPLQRFYDETIGQIDEVLKQF